MNENEVFEVLNSYKEAIDVLISEIDALKAENSALNEKVDSLKDTLFDEILEPARLAMENREREDRFEEFNEKYGEKLGAYDPTIQSIQNDKDYSLSRDVFDEYDALPEPKPDEAGFVDSSIAKVEEQIEAIKENLGIASDADVEIKQDGETGDTEIVADVDAELLHDLHADAAAAHDVEAVEVGILLVAVIRSLVPAEGAGDLGGDTDRGARAGIGEEHEVRVELKAIAEVQGDVDEMILPLAGHRRDDQVGRVALGSITVVNTRGKVEAGDHGNREADTGIEAAHRTGIRGIAGLDQVNGIEITGIDGRLRESGGTCKQQNRCGQKGNDFLHTYNA